MIIESMVYIFFFIFLNHGDGFYLKNAYKSLLFFSDFQRGDCFVVYSFICIML